VAGRAAAEDAGTMPATPVPKTAADIPATTAAGRARDSVSRDSVWRDPVAWVIAACVFGAYDTLSLLKLIQFAPASWDLGIYTEYVKDLAGLHAPIVDVRGPGFNLLGDHFQVAVAVLAPFFRLFPTPATLLFFQAAFAAVSVFPVVAAGRALAGGRAAGRLIGFAYGFSWGLQQMIEFDFHEIALAVPLLAFSLSGLVRGRVRSAVLWAVPLVFVKEDQGFTVAAIGAYLVIASVAGYRGRSALWGGTFLFGWGLFWSVFAIAVIIPHFNPEHVYYYWKDGGVVRDGTPLSVTATLGQTLAGWPVKLGTIVMLLLPVAFTALGSPVALVAVPDLALRFLSTNSAYWGTQWHYNATVMPILFIAAIDAIARWRAGEPGFPAISPALRPVLGPVLRPVLGPLLGRVLRPLADGWRAARAGLARHAAPMMAIAAVALAFQFPLSGLWNASTYRINPHVAADNAAMAVVPDGATVQTTLDFLAPLAARTDTYWIGNAGNPLTQYIVFDGLASGYSPAPSNVPAFIRQLYPKAGYVLIFSRDGDYVFRRG
jgi:uncharacterized membrane protein